MDNKISLLVCVCVLISSLSIQAFHLYNPGPAVVKGTYQEQTRGRARHEPWEYWDRPFEIQPGSLLSSKQKNMYFSKKAPLIITEPEKAEVDIYQTLGLNTASSPFTILVIGQKPFKIMAIDDQDLKLHNEMKKKFAALERQKEALEREQQAMILARAEGGEIAEEKKKGEAKATAEAATQTDE